MLSHYINVTQNESLGYVNIIYVLRHVKKAMRSAVHVRPFLEFIRFCTYIKIPFFQLFTKNYAFTLNRSFFQNSYRL